MLSVLPVAVSCKCSFITEVTEFCRSFVKTNGSIENFSNSGSGIGHIHHLCLQFYFITPSVSLFCFPPSDPSAPDICAGSLWLWPTGGRWTRFSSRWIHPGPGQLWPQLVERRLQWPNRHVPAQLRQAHQSEHVNGQDHIHSNQATHHHHSNHHHFHHYCSCRHQLTLPQFSPRHPNSLSFRIPPTPPVFLVKPHNKRSRQKEMQKKNRLWELEEQRRSSAALLCGWTLSIMYFWMYLGGLFPWWILWPGFNHLWNRN